mgnify:CR=1 FL=1
MATRVIDPSLGAAVTANNIYTRGLQGEVWKDFDFVQAQTDPSYGYFKLYRWDEWTDISSSTSNPWATVTEVSQGTTNRIDGTSTRTGFTSQLEVDLEATPSAGYGHNIQFKPAGIYATSGIKCYFDIMVSTATISTGPQFFVGFSDVDTTIFGSNILTTGYKIGFKAETSATVYMCSGNNAVPTAATTSPKTLVDAATTTSGAELTRLGFAFEPGGSQVWSVDGTRKASDLASSTLPTGAVICPSIVFQAGGSVRSKLNVPYMAVGYKFQ